MKAEPPEHTAPDGQASQLPFCGLREKVEAEQVEQICAVSWT